MYVFFVLLVFEGAIRKWFLPALSTEVYLLKYVILFAAFIIFLSSYLSNIKQVTCMTTTEILIWFVWGGIFMAFYFGSEFSIISLAGAMYYLAPLPVLMMFPIIVRSLENLSRLVVIYLSVAIGVCLLGFVQYSSPPDSALNLYVNGNVGDVATFGEDVLGVSRVRITGTFSYISSYTTYLQFMIPLAWASLLNSTRKRNQLISATALAFLLANITMTGSRAPFIFSVAGSVPFLISGLSRVAGQKVSRFNLVVLVVIGLGGAGYLATGALAGLEDRNEGAGDASSRVSGAFLTPFNTFRDIEPLGEGLGSTAYNVALATNEQDRVSQSFDEVAHDRIGIETGYIGYLYVLFVKAFCTFSSVSLYLRAKSLPAKRWLLVSLMYQVTTLWSIPVHAAVGFIEYLVCLALNAWLRENVINDRRYGS